MENETSSISGCMLTDTTCYDLSGTLRLNKLKLLFKFYQ